MITGDYPRVKCPFCKTHKREGVMKAVEVECGGFKRVVYQCILGCSIRLNPENISDDMYVKPLFSDN